MQSMWTAVSDRDYYGEPEIALEDRPCMGCGAKWDQGEVCEENCPENAAAVTEPSYQGEEPLARRPMLGWHVPSSAVCNDAA